MTFLRFSSDPFDSILRLQRALTQSVGGSRAGAELTPSGRGVFPALNIFEAKEGDAIVVKAEVPGIDSSQIQVETFGDRLTIAGERKIEAPEEGFRYHRRERRAGEFRRVFRLPFEVDRDSGRAGYENGILTIHLEKAEQAKPRSIQISA